MDRLLLTHKSMDRSKSVATAKSAARRRYATGQPRHEGFSVLYQLERAVIANTCESNGTARDYRLEPCSLHGTKVQFQFGINALQYDLLNPRRHRAQSQDRPVSSSQARPQGIMRRPPQFKDAKAEVRRRLERDPIRSVWGAAFGQPIAGSPSEERRIESILRGIIVGSDDKISVTQQRDRDH